MIWDQNKLKYESLLNRIKHVSTKKNIKDMSKSKIYFYDSNNKLFMKADFEYIGNYYNKYKLWIWSWAVPLFWLRHFFKAAPTTTGVPSPRPVEV